MRELTKQIFRYSGEDLIAGGELVDKQVREWYAKHPKCRVVSLHDERYLDVIAEDHLECTINVVMEFLTKEDNDGTGDKV